MENHCSSMAARSVVRLLYPQISGVCELLHIGGSLLAGRLLFMFSHHREDVREI
jgi:hypothetical protein